MFDVLERDFSFDVWEDEGGPAISSGYAVGPAGATGGGPSRSLRHFHNDAGSAVISIAARAFKCIGATPPSDHPHIYLEMGERGSVLCPYCATRFSFDASLGGGETRPPGCSYDEGRPALRRADVATAVMRADLQGSRLVPEQPAPGFLFATSSIR